MLGRVRGWRGIEPRQASVPASRTGAGHLAWGIGARNTWDADYELGLRAACSPDPPLPSGSRTPVSPCRRGIPCRISRSPQGLRAALLRLCARSGTLHRRQPFIRVPRELGIEQAVLPHPRLPPQYWWRFRQYRSLVALALGPFGAAEFLRSVNRMDMVGAPMRMRMRMRDMRPSLAELRQAFPAMLRGTGIGVLFGAIPGTGPTITTFVA